MGGSLGKCRVCGGDAGVVYPLLPGSPAFCSGHHNQESAGPFGCDFSGPDDFDIPWCAEDIPFTSPRVQKLDRDTFIWTDKGETKHSLAAIDDQYLQNIINYLKRGEGHTIGGAHRRKRVIDFLVMEQTIWAAGRDSSVGEEKA